MGNIFKALFFAMIISLLVTLPTSSYADGNDHNGNNRDSHNNGHHDHSFVGVNFSVWPDSYYYGAPYYSPADVALVSPPTYEPVAINGTTYYLNNGAYYMYNGYGYQPVMPPVTVVQQPETAEVIDNPAGTPEGPVITPAGTSSDASDSFTINIPNNKGGYIAVTLKKSGNGYIGPQGEFYPEFPSVSKLEVIYGK